MISIYNTLCLMFTYITIYDNYTVYNAQMFPLVVRNQRLSGEGNLVIARNRSLL